MKTSINFFRDTENAKSVAAGETIFREGDPGDVMYGVQEGIVDIVVRGEVLESVQAGGIFGEMALVDNSARSATALAQTDCKIVPMNEANFLFKVQHNPIFALFIMRTLAERLRRETRR